MNRIRSSKEKRKEAATAPRLVLWLGSINSSSNLSRKSHSSYATANTDSETKAETDTWLTKTDNILLNRGSLLLMYKYIK